MDPFDASPAPWIYNGQQTGRAMPSGGWMHEYSLGQVNPSPEFDFPLQLIYQTQRPHEGLFGSGWFCPQLESSILPSERKTLLWTSPSGDEIRLEQNPKQADEYRSRDRLWVAKISSAAHVVANEEGWEYYYNKGKMTSIISPTRRVLELDWHKNRLLNISFYDSVSHTRRAILVAIYGADKRLASFTSWKARFTALPTPKMARLSAFPLGDHLLVR